MYSDADLDAAIEAGVLTPAAVADFRAYAAAQRSSPVADEEHFRLLTGFNDIFVSIATLLMLVALGWLGGQISPGIGAILTGAASWALSEYFTLKRRMALPSIVLLVAFTMSGYFAVLFAFTWFSQPDMANPLGLGGALAGAGIAAYIHWRRFMVPITLALLSAAAVGSVLLLLLAAFPAVQPYQSPLFLVGGVGVFALAMRWDISDLDRKTRRSDVAFWLHLAAAPMMVHPVFAMLGLANVGLIFLPRAGTEPLGLGAAALAVAIYVGLAGVALAIDRRALLVSSLFYVLYALSTLFRAAGSLSFSLGLTALVIGSGLLLLSAFWHRARMVMLNLVPAGLRRRLPPS